jgi:hypothetical protein
MSSKKRVIEESEEESPEKRPRVAVKAENGSDSSDDDIPISQLIKKQAVPANDKRKPAAADSDSEDDVPIAELIKRKQAGEAASKAVANKEGVKKKLPPKSPTLVEKKVKKPSAPTSRPKGEASNSSLISDAYYLSAKGQLVQKLLVRWWYAISWPDAKATTAPVPEGYEPLDGFPGVFVSTSVRCFGRDV